MPDRPFGHALHLMHEGEFRHVPLVENGRLLGMVSAHDALGPDLRQFIGASGMCAAIQSSTGAVQHSTWPGMMRCRIVKSSRQSRIARRFCVTLSQYQPVRASSSAQRPGPNLKSGSQTSIVRRSSFIVSSVMKKFEFQSIGALNAPSNIACSRPGANPATQSALVASAASRSSLPGFRPGSGAIAPRMVCR